MSVLVVDNLQKAYKGRRVVEGLSLQVAAGEVVGLLGPNGAGKTTAFYMIVGLVQADAGSVRLDDVDLTGLPRHRLPAAGSFGVPAAVGRRQHPRHP